MATVYLSLGSNKGDRKTLIDQALSLIDVRIGKLVAMSSLYRSASWGFDSSDFLNQVVKVDTGSLPRNVLAECLAIEKILGRERGSGSGYSDRTIDIDILFYNEQIIDEVGLVIPHPHIHKRKFILMPMNEIAPGLVHPVMKKTIAALLSECADDGDVEPVAR